MTPAAVITSDHLLAAQSYEAYRQMIADRLAKSQTTGSNHSEEMVHYTELNVQRMHRLDKVVELSDALQAEVAAVAVPWTWLVLTEAWCGDAAQSVPVMAKIADASPYITLRLLLRDEHPELMDAYLTHGSRSIPKLICLTEDHQEVGTWGPRPAEAQQVINDFKAEHPDSGYQELVKELQLWYARDRTQAIQREFAELLSEWNQVFEPR